MEILRIELPLQREPQFFCPYSGYNLVTEGLNDAVDEGYICLSVNWNDPDEYVLADDEMMGKYMDFEYEVDGDPTDRVVAFLKHIGADSDCFIIELTVNAMACGPICDTNTFVFRK